MKKLSELGYWISVRINPLFPIFPDGYYSDPEFGRASAPPPFDYFSWDMIPALAASGVNTVLAGVVRLYPPNVRFMNEVLGWDVRRLLSVDARIERASYHVSDAEQSYYYERIRDLCHQNGVRFSVCYIGTDPTGEAFFKHRPLWDNSKDCCDMAGNVRGFNTVAVPADRLLTPRRNGSCSVQ